MELAEGEDLSEKIESGGVTVDQAENIARQLARGLEVAHEQGIVHRDLKPANIKVSPDGSVKILDFGLARAFAAEPATDVLGAASDMPTMTQALTGAGAVMGTTAYMSPEQARGYEVDRRSDIWAFGVILYEMLTGTRLFEGQTASDVMAAVLRQEPDWEAMTRELPPHLVQICSRCLVKDPRQRLRDIGEARIALGASGTTFIGRAPDASSIAPVAPRTSNRRAWLIAAALGIALAASALLGFTGLIGPEPEQPDMVRATITVPDHVGLHLIPTSPGPVKVSPDGSTLAYTGQDSTGQALLFIRRLDKAEAYAIAGTNDAAYPFWSPDSRSVAFFSGGEMRRVDVAGGPVISVCKGENPKGGSWNLDDQIIFAPAHNSPIHIVSANGGTPTPVTSLQNGQLDRSHRFPIWLPDGRHFLYLAVERTSGTTVDENSELRMHSLDDDSEQSLMVCQTNVAIADEHIIYAFDDILMARPFSTDKLEFTGPAVPLTSGVMNIQGAHLGVFSAVSSGTLAYAPSGHVFNQAALQWLDVDGQTRDLDPGAKITIGFDVSPSGEHVAMSVIDDATGTADLWLLEIARDLRTRLTFATEVESNPVWSADGLWITYANDGDGRSQVYRKLVSGIGEPEQLTNYSGEITPSDWSADGRYIACSITDTTGNNGIAVLDLESREIVMFRNSEFTEAQPVYSPDDRWLAYVSNETGDPEIFVESMVAGGGRWRVSTSGGVNPLWSPSGDRIHYVTLAGRVLSTVVNETGGGLRFGETIQLGEGVGVSPSRNIAVNNATGELLVTRSMSQDRSNMMNLVTHWQQLIDR
jgi:eukaryotic-like serine/threonine-protein kinase